MAVAASTRSIRTAQQMLAEAAGVTFPALRQAVDQLPQAVGLLVGVHFGWRDISGALLPGGNASVGKAVRPALTLLSCETAGGTPQAGVPAAVAVELVHNASLLHDDIIDGDRLRRGRRPSGPNWDYPPRSWPVMPCSSWPPRSSPRPRPRWAARRAWAC